MSAEQNERQTWLQEQHIPVNAGSSVRQQLHGWAGHGAAVRVGCDRLHVATELHGCPENMAIYPRLDIVAAQCSQGATKVWKLARLPASESRLDLQQLLAKRRALTCYVLQGWEESAVSVK